MDSEWLCVYTHDVVVNNFSFQLGQPSNSTTSLPEKKLAVQLPEILSRYGLPLWSATSILGGRKAPAATSAAVLFASLISFWLGNTEFLSSTGQTVSPLKRLISKL